MIAVLLRAAHFEQDEAGQALRRKKISFFLKKLHNSFAQFQHLPTFASPLEKLGFAICLSESE
jgi:hypothetical protein